MIELCRQRTLKALSDFQLQSVSLSLSLLYLSRSLAASLSCSQCDKLATLVIIQAASRVLPDGDNKKLPQFVRASSDWCAQQLVEAAGRGVEGQTVSGAAVNVLHLQHCSMEMWQQQPQHRDSYK